MPAKQPKDDVYCIRRRLKELGKTQKWLAAQIGVSEQTMSAWVNGKIYLGIGNDWRNRLKRVLGIDETYMHR